MAARASDATPTMRRHRRRGSFMRRPPGLTRDDRATRSSATMSRLATAMPNEPENADAIAASLSGTVMIVRTGAVVDVDGATVRGTVGDASAGTVSATVVGDSVVGTSVVSSGGTVVDGSGAAVV